MVSKPSKKTRQSRAKVRLWGAPAPADFKRTKIGRVLSRSAKFHVQGAAAVDKLLALEKLALDVFVNSASARAFAANPQAYMSRAGLRNVKLDLNSPEVRLAMAMGDPAVRQAAGEGDAVALVRAVMAQGLDRLGVGPTGGIIVAEVVIHASVIASAVAVAVTHAVAVTKAVAVVDVVVSGDETILTRQVEVLSNVAEELGRPDLARQIRTPKIRQLLRRYNELASKET
jgi:hypothetical protein